MKKFGTTALAVLTAVSLSAFCVGCKKETKKPEPAKPAGTSAPAGGEKPKEGGH